MNDTDLSNDRLVVDRLCGKNKADAAASLVSASGNLLDR